MIDYEAGDFEAYVNRAFSVRGDRYVVTLVQVDRLGGAGQGTHDAFILLFRRAGGDVLPEGVYTFDIEDGAHLTFYIMPIHTEAAGRQDYQAVFN